MSATPGCNVDEILNEINLMAVLRHECICSVYGSCKLGNDAVRMLFEHIPGGDLAGYLNREESLPHDVQINLCHQAAMAVNYLHSIDPPVLHRDLKASNYLVLNNSRLKLTDFGVSKVKSMAKLTPAGTFNWMAPEVLRNPPQWNEKADIFSLGMVFYEIASHQIPFHDVPEGDVIAMILRGERPNIQPLDTPPVRFSFISTTNIHEGCAEHD